MVPPWLTRDDVAAGERRRQPLDGGRRAPHLRREALAAGRRVARGVLARRRHRRPDRAPASPPSSGPPSGRSSARRSRARRSARAGRRRRRRCASKVWRVRFSELTIGDRVARQHRRERPERALRPRCRNRRRAARSVAPRRPCTGAWRIHHQLVAGIAAIIRRRRSPPAPRPRPPPAPRPARRRSVRRACVGRATATASAARPATTAASRPAQKPTANSAISSASAAAVATSAFAGAPTPAARPSARAGRCQRITAGSTAREIAAARDQGERRRLRRGQAAEDRGADADAEQQRERAEGADPVVAHDRQPILARRSPPRPSAKSPRPSSCSAPVSAIDVASADEGAGERMQAELEGAQQRQSGDQPDRRADQRKQRRSRGPAPQASGLPARPASPVAVGVLRAIGRQVRNEAASSKRRHQAASALREYRLRPDA